MKNKEKYADVLKTVDEIEEFALTKDGVPSRCLDIVCGDCFFSSETYPYPQGSCIENFYHWLEQAEREIEEEKK